MMDDVELLVRGWRRLTRKVARTHLSCKEALALLYLPSPWKLHRDADLDGMREAMVRLAGEDPTVQRLGRVLKDLRHTTKVPRQWGTERLWVQSMVQDEVLLWTVSTERQRAMWARAYDRKLAGDVAAAAKQRLCMRLRCGRVMDLKVEDVAEKAGCGVRTVRRWVRGKGQPTPEVYAKLCIAICGCSRCVGIRRVGQAASP